MNTTRSLWAVCLCLVLGSAAVHAQNAPITFEPGAPGNGWTWTVFENATNPAVEMVPNPAVSAANPSATVARFTALQAGQPWAGCESQHGSDIGTFSFNETNCTVRLMVYKSVVSNVGVKFARADGGADTEILVANTLVNQWEELVFDFSGRIGTAGGTNLDQIIFFPDFNLAGRTGDNVVYLDNVTFGPRQQQAGPATSAPAPAHHPDGVISLFSDAYTNVPVDTWSASWDQADVSSYELAGDGMKHYLNLVYAGIEFTSQTIDASAMTHVHLDLWTAQPTSLPTAFRFKLVDFGANGVWSGGDDVEHELAFDASTNPALATGEWVSLDLPLSAFSGLTTRGHLAQVVLSGTLANFFIDNLYFHNGTVDVEAPAVRPAAATLLPNHPNPFNPSTTLAVRLASAAPARLAVHDLSGRLVRTLVDGMLPAGVSEVRWDGNDAAGVPVASGLYISRLEVGGETACGRLTLLR